MAKQQSTNQKQVIKDVEAVLDVSFNALPDLVWLKDPEGVYLSCNHHFERFFGAKKAQILGKTDYDFVEKELADFFRKNDLKALEANDASVNEEWLDFADGSHSGLFETIKKPLYSADKKLLGVLGIARDITLHKKDKDALAQAELKLNTALNATKIGVWDWDLATDTWSATASYFTMLGYEPVSGEANRADELDKVHPEDRAFVLNKIQLILQQTSTDYQYEARIRHANGEYRWVEVRCTVMEFDDDNKPLRMLGVRIDIDDLKQAQKRAEWLGRHDPLTQLPNRTMLNAFFEQSRELADQHQSNLALLFVDLDRFKNVNDTLGHRIGDELLITVAKRLQSLFGANSIVTRQGGDEFIVLIPMIDEAKVIAKAQQIKQHLSERYHLDGHQLVITPSIGISLYPCNARDIDTLYKYADIAMYHAKQAGRNCYLFFNENMQQHTIRLLQLENAMFTALDNDEFSLNYQPQISLHTGLIVGAEVLLRWQNSELGAVSPAEFIPIAEDSGQILDIGEWVFKKSAQQMKAWLEEGLSNVKLAINLSAVQFRQQDLPQRIAEIINEIGLTAKYLELELTESVTMDNPNIAIETMKKFESLGLSTSIDDFGTGYSSLNYLKRFPVYKLKIDRSFVNNMTTDENDRAIVEAVIALAKSLGLKTIAEGVETKQQISLLKRMGCDEVQGYYFSRPLPDQEFYAYLQSDTSQRLLKQAEQVAMFPKALNS